MFEELCYQYITTVTNLTQTESQKLDESKNKHTEKISDKNKKSKFIVQKQKYFE